MEKIKNVKMAVVGDELVIKVSLKDLNQGKLNSSDLSTSGKAYTVASAGGYRDFLDLEEYLGIPIGINFLACVRKSKYAEGVGLVSGSEAKPAKPAKPTVKSVDERMARLEEMLMQLMANQGK